MCGFAAFDPLISWNTAAELPFTFGHTIAHGPSPSWQQQLNRVNTPMPKRHVFSTVPNVISLACTEHKTNTTKK
jgi:hypothetical protein